jgi:hypothetical protein
MKTTDLFAKAFAENKTADSNPAPVEETISSDDISFDTGIQEENSGEDTGSDTEDFLSQDQSNSSSSEDSLKKTPSDKNIEYVTATDHTGRKVKVKVDYSDKDSIKRAVSMAAGARKWQVERDNYKKELDSYKEQSGKKVDNWDLISSVYEDKGLKGLVNFPEGREDAFDSLVDSANQEREWRARATPEELALYQERQERSNKDKELEKIRQELEAIKQGQASTAEQAELSSIKAEINPVFDKYRFSGKLGNPQHEHILDEMLWTNALKQLENYPENIEITPSIVNKVFRDYSSSLRELVNKQVDKKVSSVVASKKRHATEAAQVQAAKNMSKGTGTETATDLIRQGRTSDLFRMVASKSKKFI